jgi:hypothetical protein
MFLTIKILKGESILEKVCDYLIKKGLLDEDDRLIEIYDKDEFGYFDEQVEAQEDCECYVTQDGNTGEFGIRIRTLDWKKVDW